MYNPILKILQIPDINKFLIKISEMKELFDATREASIQLALLDTETINQVLNDVADAAIAHTEEILASNAKDLARMDEKNPM